MNDNKTVELLERERQIRRDMSDFLTYRYFITGKSAFSKHYPINNVSLEFERIPVKGCKDFLCSIEKQIKEATKDGKAAIALSGGIDSAIMAKFMPKGSVAYTFRCVVPGKQVVDESERAALYAKECGLEHRIVDITWEDIISVIDKLILHKGAPIHSIEAQIYIASLKAKEDGFKKFVFGENADIIYGGFDGLLSKDWLVGEFIERYSFVLPYKVMYHPEPDYTPFYKIEKNGYIDPHEFMNIVFRQESLGSYGNACETAGIELVAPCSNTVMAEPLDYMRVRNGESKYIIREAFKELYPGWEIPVKTPMPRATNEWMESWGGPTRKEFIPNCHKGMSGDQKWMIYVLERYLNLME